MVLLLYFFVFRAELSERLWSAVTRLSQSDPIALKNKHFPVDNNEK